MKTLWFGLDSFFCCHLNNALQKITLKIHFEKVLIFSLINLNFGNAKRINKYFFYLILAFMPDAFY